jgi:nucleoside phosphorylase
MRRTDSSDSAGPNQWRPTKEADDPINWVILTAIPLEYHAAVSQLREPVDPEGWPLPVTVGTIGNSRVICVLTGKGSKRTAVALQYIAGRTRASKVVMVGIAGGFPEQQVARGDIVIARSVLGYDFGKLVDGKYIRRPEEDWQCDDGLVSHAEVIAKDIRRPWSESMEMRRPDGQPTSSSKVLVGYVASGDKVVDDADHGFFREVRAFIPEVHAVEMEAAGAGAAVRFNQMLGVMRFIMIKGISDQPIQTVRQKPSQEKSNALSGLVTLLPPLRPWRGASSRR